MRLPAAVVIAVVFLAALPSLASEPGQPLDCSDMTFDLPGLTCTVLAPLRVTAEYGSYFSRGSNISFDNEGSLLIAVNTQPAPGATQAVEVRRSPNGGLTDERLARVAFRDGPGYVDAITIQWPSGASALDQRSLFEAPLGIP